MVSLVADVTLSCFLNFFDLEFRLLAREQFSTMWKRNGTMNRVVVTDLLLRLSAVFVHLWNVLFWIKNWILVAYNLCVNSFMSRITVIPLCRVNGFVWLVFVWYNFSRSFFLVNNHEFPPPHPPTHPSLSFPPCRDSYKPEVVSSRLPMNDNIGINYFNWSIRMWNHTDENQIGL